ncbi:hypothetical protein I4U23_010527 [Adineta vaga]|nr:hypothetical protein I4U23_010527 [Adineta vaga]
MVFVIIISLYFITILLNQVEVPVLITSAESTISKPHRGPDGTWLTFNTWRRIAQRLDYIFVTSQYI